MKQIIFLLLLGIYFSMEKTIAQESMGVAANTDVQSLLAMSKTIQSGEIHIAVNEQWKGKSTMETEEYKITFYKTGKINKYHEVEFYYNILNVTDSMRYVFNGETWYIINHKKKTYEIDTNWCEISCSFPLIFPIVLTDNMLSFYVRQNLRGAFLNAAEILDIQKTDTSVFLKTKTFHYFPINARKSQKLLYVYTDEYEWNVNTSLLFRYGRILQDDKSYPRRTIIKHETILLDASLNDEKYTNAQLYNGLDYIQSYKSKHK